MCPYCDGAVKHPDQRRAQDRATRLDGFLLFVIMFIIFGLSAVIFLVRLGILLVGFRSLCIFCFWLARKLSHGVSGGLMGDIRLVTFKNRIFHSEHDFETVFDIGIFAFFSFCFICIRRAVESSAAYRCPWSFTGDDA